MHHTDKGEIEGPSLSSCLPGLQYGTSRWLVYSHTWKYIITSSVKIFPPHPNISKAVKWGFFQNDLIQNWFFIALFLEQLSFIWRTLPVGHSGLTAANMPNLGYRQIFQSLPVYILCISSFQNAHGQISESCNENSNFLFIKAIVKKCSYSGSVGK